MKAKDLIKILEKNPEMEIVMSKDAEGNGFSPLGGVDKSAYVPYNGWSGEIGLLELTPELEKQGYTEEDVMNGEPVYVLWPNN